MVDCMCVWFYATLGFQILEKAIALLGRNLPWLSDYIQHCWVYICYLHGIHNNLATTDIARTVCTLY